MGLLVSLIFIVICVAIFNYYGLSIDGLRNSVRSYGNWGIIVLTVLMILSVMSPLPDTPTSIISTVVYGPIIGGLIIFIGGSLGAIFDFIIIRALGREYISEKFPKTMAIINGFAKKFGFEAMVFFRIFPTVTFDIASYTSALTKVKFLTFALATIIGMIAPTITYSLIGEGINSGQTDQLILSVVLGLFIVAGVLLITKVFFKGWEINSLDE